RCSLHAPLFPYTTLFRAFDSDDESVFEAQRQFVHEARIGLAMVNILCAIPQTPLFKRLSAAGRLVAGEVINRHSTFAVSNVVPRSEEHTSELQSLAYLVC